jgi:hypothetical protein
MDRYERIEYQNDNDDNGFGIFDNADDASEACICLALLDGEIDNKKADELRGQLNERKKP